MRKYFLIFSLFFILATMVGCSANLPNDDSNAVDIEDTYVDLDDPADMKEYEELTGYWIDDNATLPTGVKSDIELELEEDKTFTISLFYVDEDGNRTTEDLDDPNEIYKGLYELVLNSNEITFDINIVEKDGETYIGNEVDDQVDNLPEIATAEYSLSGDDLNLKANIGELHFTRSYDF